MSKFNEFARKLDETAKAAFAAYREAESEYKSADKALKEARYTGATNAATIAAEARARARFVEAETALNQAKREFDGRMNELASIRGELAQAVENEFCADPAKLDMATLELLKSGIVSDNEIVRLARSAMNENNATMARLIGKFAKDRADAMKSDSGRDDPAAQPLRVIAAECQRYNGSAWLEAFDYLADVYRRTVRTPSLIDRWDEMTAQTIESF